jgi:hypothetical protein
MLGRATMLLFRAVVSGQVLDQFSQRLQLLLIDEIELANEVIIVLEARVQVRLFAQTDNFVEVTVINVRVYSEQSLEDGLDHQLEVLRERHLCGTVRLNSRRRAHIGQVRTNA